MKKSKVVVIVIFTLLGISAAAALMHWTVFSDPEDNLAQFMSRHYGVLDPTNKFWQKPAASKDNDGEPAGFEICAENASNNETKVFMLAVCSVPSVAGGSHSDSGTIELYVIDRGDKQYKAVASLKIDGFGSFGSPGTVKVVQLGKSLYGFEIEGGGVWQGVFISTTGIYVPYKDTFKEALIIRSAYNDEGQLDCENCSEQAVDLQRTIEIKPDAESSLYPIQIKEKSAHLGKETDTTYIVRFDQASSRYIYPKELEPGAGNYD